ncbi:hypothetical protein HMPREF9371_0257 [Neisseria shayeganii 871]|uniref:Uncharacterized protein n=1 Tax=Neisseria shayeganii 871 TaxID=1032488 RepID=G4CF68_9NEIS|nr:hypothetical protein HMPREF9371_0257 [Neisseria shayeganii 871]
MICLPHGDSWRSRSLRCYALNCIHIWSFCKGLRLPESRPWGFL